MNNFKGQMSFKRVRPFLLLEVSLIILRRFGTWAPRQKGISRNFIHLYACYIFMFVMASFFIVETVDIIINWGDMDKLAAGIPLLLTNLAHTYKVQNISR